MGWLLRADLWRGSKEGCRPAARWAFKALVGVVLVLVAYLWMYHGTLLYRYLTWPLVG